MRSHLRAIGWLQPLLIASRKFGESRCGWRIYTIGRLPKWRWFIAIRSRKFVIEYWFRFRWCRRYCRLSIAWLLIGSLELTFRIDWIGRLYVRIRTFGSFASTEHCHVKRPQIRFVGRCWIRWWCTSCTKRLWQNEIVGEELQMVVAIRGKHIIYLTSEFHWHFLSNLPVRLIGQNKVQQLFVHRRRRRWNIER